MRLLFKQRFFSWLDSYDIYDESGNIAYVVKGQLSWGHCLKVYDAMGQEAGLLQERIFTWLPKFEIYTGGQYRGCSRKEFSLFTPRNVFDCCGWQEEGNFIPCAVGTGRWPPSARNCSTGRILMCWI